MKTIMTMLGSCFLLLACSRGPDAEPAPVAEAPKAAEPAAAPAPPVAEAEPVPADLPVTEDYEQESERSITAATYKQELAALSQEIDADKAPL